MLCGIPLSIRNVFVKLGPKSGNTEIPNKIEACF